MTTPLTLGLNGVARLQAISYRPLFASVGCWFEARRDRRAINCLGAITLLKEFFYVARASADHLVQQRRTLMTLEVVDHFHRPKKILSGLG
ncbi:hypothetical protein FHS52_003138 [Erythromicrobium ramosum]|uniref:Uncharacterized protein n=1 Tax=Erythrobacter ramosus TaxID=35811 RepID=A0ABR6I2K6_9SPHN|nr:hypothetical protein [Erythrobacter ramosus]MBB3777143.1 hypothetical protein [Erythrobacter ramosus]